MTTKWNPTPLTGALKRSVQQTGEEVAEPGRRTSSGIDTDRRAGQRYRRPEVSRKTQ
jgi:hypothetical protein